MRFFTTPMNENVSNEFSVKRFEIKKNFLVIFLPFNCRHRRQCGKKDGDMNIQQKWRSLEGGVLLSHVTHSFSLSLTLTHAHLHIQKHTHTLSLSLWHTLIPYLSHALTHTHTHTLTHSP